MAKILFHAREAGIASFLVPIVDYLKKIGHQIFVDSEDGGKIYLPPHLCKDPSVLNLVVCGYDTPESDKTGSFLKSIKDLKCPKISILDTWKGVDRFWYPNGKLRPLTEKIAIPDENLKEYLVKAGIEKERLVVTGHPGLEMMNNISKEEKIERQDTLKRQLDLSNKKLVTFYSEPIFKDSGLKTSLLDAKTHNEKKIPQLVEEKFGKDYHLCYKIHPVEKATPPKTWTNLESFSITDSILISDVILGLSSTALLYGIAANKDVRSIWSELKEWKPEETMIPQNIWDKSQFKDLSLNKFCNKKSEYKMSYFEALRKNIQFIEENIRY